MNFKITLESINKITDPNGNILLRYPEDCLLKLIYPDIWGAIIKYYISFTLFAIGDIETDFPGYRPVTTKEMKDKIFFQIFSMSYQTCEGIYLLNDVKSTNTVYICSPAYCPLTIKHTALYIYKSSGGKFVKFYYSGEYMRILADVESISIGKYSYAHNGVGLYIRIGPGACQG